MVLFWEFREKKIQNGLKNQTDAKNGKKNHISTLYSFIFLHKNVIFWRWPFFSMSWHGITHISISLVKFQVVSGLELQLLVTMESCYLFLFNVLQSLANFKKEKDFNNILKTVIVGQIWPPLPTKVLLNTGSPVQLELNKLN